MTIFLLVGILGIGALFAEKAIATIFDHYFNTPEGRHIYRKEKSLCLVKPLCIKSGCNVRIGKDKGAKFKFMNQGPNHLNFSVSLYATFSGSLCSNILYRVKGQYVTFRVRKIDSWTNVTKNCGGTYKLEATNIKGMPGVFEKKLFEPVTLCDLFRKIF